MTENKSHQDFCIDCGTENCPCVLASSGDCLVCGKLQAKNLCDCCWNGVCVYNEFVQRGGTVNRPRDCFNAKIVLKEKYLSDLFVFGLEVEKGFALRAAAPGSFIFVQPDEASPFFSTPVSILKSDLENNTIYILIKAIAAKTKRICSAEDYLSIRGVFRNGIIGINPFMHFIKSGSDDVKLLVITKGVGFAPAINLVHLCKNRPNVYLELIVDKDKICSAVINDYLDSSAVNSLSFISMANDRGMSALSEYISLSGCNAVAVLASDYYQERIRSLLKPDIMFMHSNNAALCCGEGVCGACCFTDSTGKCHKRCKCF